MTAAIVLAANAARVKNRRALSDDIRGVSALKRIITVYQLAGVQRIVVVAGADAENIERHCARMGVIFLRDDEFGFDDMLPGIKTGLDYLRDKCSRVFISPANISMFSLETIKSVVAASAPLITPVYSGKEGYPVLLAKNLFDRVLEYDGSGSLRNALPEDDPQYCLVEVPDKGVLTDIREDINVGCLADNQGLRTIRPEFKVSLTSEKAFFGPGTLLLLKLTRETGSLMHASQRMGLSYSKAVKMVKGIEEQLGYKVLESKKGGNIRGSSSVTDKGEELMSRFAAFEYECDGLIKGAFERHFGDFAGEITSSANSE